MIPHVNDSKKEVDDLDQLYQYEKENHFNWYDQVLLSRPLRVTAALILVAILAPLLIYQFVFFSSLDLPPSDGFSVGSCILQRSARLPCGFGDVSQSECHPQCCYDLNSNLCFHRYPSRFSYIMDQIWSEEIVLRPRISTVPFASQNSLRDIRLSIDEVSSTHLSLHFYNSREMSLTGRRIDNKNYTYDVSSPEMSVTVNASHGQIFSTVRTPLIASEDIWELGFILTEETMFGFGEIPLKQDTVKVIYNHKSGLSSVPLIFALSNGSYHGLLIDTKAPTEVSIHGDNQVVVRSITSLGLKFHVFVGPSPKDIMHDVIELIGFNKHLEYWMLGTHICSELSESISDSYSNMEEFIQNAVTENLPFESHCGATPIVFESKCENENQNIIENGASLVRSSGKRFVPQVSPYIRYYEEVNETLSEEIVETNECVDIVQQYEEIMLRDSLLDLYVGTVDEDTFVYPLYENITTNVTMLDFMQSLWTYDVVPDGVILENNWPLDDSEKSNDTHLFLPYFNKNFEVAFDHTPKWDTRRPDGSRYFDEHNEYGNHFISAFETLFENNVTTWTSSQWMNGAVAINRQNIDTSWTSLRRELAEAAFGGISGHWIWNTPVCGDLDTFDASIHSSLCVKWYMAATYMPFIKIHSTTTERHPLAFTGTNKNYMIEALKRRISLLPYFFTTLQSGPLLRPMFYQFPQSEGLKELNTQYSVGDDLLIVPNLQPSQTHVHVWLPPGSWYEFWGGLKLDGEEGEAVTMTTTEADFLTLIRGGSIVVMQKDTRETAEQTRLNSEYSIIIALDCSPNNETEQNGDTEKPICNAMGELYLTDEMSVELQADTEEIRITANGNHFESMCGDNAISARIVRDISIYGLDDELNNYDHHREVEASIDLCELQTAERVVFSLLN